MLRKYAAIPTPSQWQSDSSVAFQVRKNDKVLDRVDTLLKEYSQVKSTPKCLITVSDLFLTADYWLKFYRTNAHMDQRRAPAVQALYECVAHSLCTLYGCTINGLPRELELMFGREMSDQGVQVDIFKRRAKFADGADLWMYRLWFKAGLAYQFPWWESQVTKTKILAESSRAYNPKAFAKKPNSVTLPNENYGPFVMTMSRDIYMREHCPAKDGSKEGIFHSFYNGGEPVAMAGTMLVRNGVIERVRGDSGHYKPLDSNMVGFLRALQMWGVALKNVLVEPFEGTDVHNALDFIEANGDWKKLNECRKATIQDNKNTFVIKPGPDLRKAPDPRGMWTKPPEVKGNPFAIKPIIPPRV